MTSASLSPARFAAALLARARDAAAPAPTTFRAEIGAQLASRQDGLYGALARAGFRASAFGPYEAGESAAPWLSCWGHTNAGQTPKPRATVDSTSCTSGTQLFIANDLSTGLVQLTHSYVRSVDLNAFQFAAFLAQQAQPGSTGWSRKWQTPQRCHEDFLAADSASDSGGATAPAHPTIHALWCARAYRAFANLYDVSVTAITEESGGEALISRLSLRGVDFDNAMALSRRFLEAVRWTRKSG